MITGALMLAAGAPLCKVMPPVPTVSVLAPPILTAPPTLVKVRLLMLKSPPSVVVVLVPIAELKKTSVAATGA